MLCLSHVRLSSPTFVNGHPYMIRNVVFSDVNYIITRICNAVRSSVNILVIVVEVQAGIST